MFFRKKIFRRRLLSEIICIILLVSQSPEAVIEVLYTFGC